MDYILVGIGGLFGSITRYLLGKFIARRSKTKFPKGTFVINITGAFLLGILSVFDANKNLYLLCGDGFLASYTTFSTFMFEGFTIVKGKKSLNALTYIMLSLIIGIAGYAIGFKFGNYIKGIL